MVAQLTKATDAAHCVWLQSVGASQLCNLPNLPNPGDRRPTIIKRTDQDFIAGLLAELSNGIQTLQGRIETADSRQVLTLFQPVHRTFYIALQEVVCDPFEHPHLQTRLDPQKIESAGLVIRRIVVDESGRERMAGWRRSNNVLQGWTPFTNSTDEDLDPNPIHRPAVMTAGNPVIDRLLLPPTSALSESVSPLFVAPPEVCQSTGRTILYGLIPLTSSEFSEAPPQPPAIRDQQTLDQVNAAIREMLPYYLQGEALSEPWRNVVLTADSADDNMLQGFVDSLRQLKLHFQAFDPTPTSQALLNELNQINLNYNTPNAQPLGEFLKRATQILVERQPGEMQMPQQWVAIDAARRDRIISHIRTILMERVGQLTAGEGRYDAPGQQYRIRTFVRIKRPDGCPPKIIWSNYSNPFTIAPWYASSDQPPIKVALPDVLDRDALAGLKPNVAFSVPPKLFNFLKNDAKNLLDGNGDEGSNLGLQWICSFNIPIITLCAYIVLNIFLQLFDLIFRWLFFIKICIPFPKK